MAMSVLTAWLYNSARGSIVIAALFHAATDAAWSYTGVLVGGPVLRWLVTALTWLAAIGPDPSRWPVAPAWCHQPRASRRDCPTSSGCRELTPWTLQPQDPAPMYRLVEAEGSRDVCTVWRR